MQRWKEHCACGGQCIAGPAAPCQQFAWPRSMRYDADEFTCTLVKEELMPSYQTIQDFIADVKATLTADDASDDLLERLAALMRDLISSPVVDQVHDEL